MEIRTHIQTLLTTISQGLYEKEHILALALLCAISGESCFLLGPPGTAKSEIARRLKLIFKDASAFEYLMSRFSTPDEIFGPVSIQKLKSEDTYERKVDGFLPSATIVFLDEIWKAGPAIQNALLTVINERIYRNGTNTLQLPMKCLIAASNELPAEDEGLEALWDRFLVRIVSNCIEDEDTFLKMLNMQQLPSIVVPDELKITNALYDQWQMVAKAHLLIQLNKVLHRGKERFEMNADSQIAMDYQFILDYERISVRYPLLKEIVDIMGRSLPKDKELKDTTITRYLPLLLSHTPIPTELDGVTMGNRLPDTLPSELVYLSDPQTEDIFFHRFATHTLQLMQSKPPSVSKEKTEHTTQALPRLIKGPIIVSVDTSGSMQGRPIQIATALLMQLLQLARQQHRACYLITYSVRAHAIDLAHPGNWNRVQDFLRNGFSGGTDGNEMLQQACQQLHEKTYSMADVLVISDFQWSHPSPSTTTQMESEKKKGTRFYGLEIGPRFQTKSHPWLDKFWNIRIDHY